MSSATSRTRLLTAFLPLLALLFDLLAALQGEAVWSYASALLLTASLAAFTARLRERRHRLVLAGACGAMLASLVLRFLAPPVPGLGPSLGTGALALSVAMLLWRGALLDGMLASRHSLLDLLESSEARDSERTPPAPLRRAS